MAHVSVAEAARRLGVGVPRIHQRIADGSLRAERIGSQWVVDELSVLRAGERKSAGRPLSARSAWALIALAEGDDEALSALAPPERARAKARLARLLKLVDGKSRSEEDIRRIAAELRSAFRNRAAIESRRVAPADLESLRQDARWESLVSPAASGIASRAIDGYVRPDDVAALERDYLLRPSAEDGNVAIHVLPAGQRPYPDSKLRLAADLADRRGAREELRAVELLEELAQELREAGHSTNAPDRPRQYPQSMDAATQSSVVLRESLARHAVGVSSVLAAYGATNARIFGSVARGDARRDSDLDLVVDLLPGQGNELLRVSGIAEELSELLGVRVDVVAPGLLRDEVSATALADAVAV